MARLTLISLAVLASFVLAGLFAEPEGVHPRVEVTGLSLTGVRTYADLRQCLDMKSRDLECRTIRLEAGGRRITVSSRALGVELDRDTIAARVWLFHRELNLLDRIRSHFSRSTMVVPLYVKIDKGKLLRVCSTLAHDPMNARVVHLGASMRLLPGTDGVAVDGDRAVVVLRTALMNGETLVSLPTTVVPASIADSDLRSNLRQKIASVSVTIVTKHQGSRHNIRQSVRRCGLIVLKPGEILSLNKRIGPRTEANGFVMGKVLEDGKPALGMGGGVCVTSTLLMQIAACSGLTIVERHCHSRIPSYTRPGTDAMLNLPRGMDFVVKNGHEFPVVLDVYGKGSRIYADAYACRPLDQSYRLATVSTRRGSQLRVTTYRVGDHVRERLFDSTYGTS